MQIKIKGQIFESQSGQNTPCQIIVNESDVYVEDIDGQRHLCARQEMKIDPPLGSVRRKIRFPDGRIFESDDLEKVDNLNNSKFWKTLSKTEKTGWHLIPIAIVTPFMAFGLYRLVIPLLIALGMALTPDEALYSIDKNSLRSIDALALDESEISHDRRVEIQKLFDQLLEARNTKLTEYKPDREFRYTLNFRKAETIGPNAFALPGGTIVVTDELVFQFPDDDVLAAILAHEIGHVEHQHSLKQLYRALGAASMISMIAGDAGPLLEDAILEGSALLSLSFSRKHEMESDNYSYELLKAADLPAHGLIDFFTKLEGLAISEKAKTNDKNDKKEGAPEESEADQETMTEKASKSDSGSDPANWFSTHPVSQHRIRNIKAKLEADGIPYSSAKGNAPATSNASDDEKDGN